MKTTDIKIVHSWAKKRNLPLPEKSNRKNKKFMVLWKGKYIHFGHSDYEDYSVHNDKKRRESYLKRSRGIRNKDGTLTKNDPMSPNFWSIRLLWDG